MKRLISLISLLILTGCSSMPEFYKTIDDIATDDAITVKCDRDCFQKNTNVKICVDVINNE